LRRGKAVNPRLRDADIRVGRAESGCECSSGLLQL